jgi:hypothetical protein
VRALKTLVAVQAAALIVLFVAWSQRTVPLAPPSAEAPRGEDPAAGAELARIALDAASSAAVPQPARVAAIDGTHGGSVRVVLHGRLLGVDPPPGPDSVRLSLRRHGTWRSGDATAQGGWSVAGLSPGVWRLRCEVVGCRMLEFEHTLGAAPVQRLDLQLERATVLPVFIRTPDGGRFEQSLMALRVLQGLRVVAAQTPFVGDFPPTENSSMSDVGIGRYRPHERNRPPAEHEPDGTLELDRDPPAHAAVLLRHLVIAQQPIDPGQSELRFVVDPEVVRARFPTVHLRLLGPNGPVTRASVRLSTAQGGGFGGPGPDEHGVVVVEHALPGLNAIEIQGPTIEHFNSHVLIPTGSEFDLGDIVLTAPTEIHGRTVDAEGAPVAARVQWTAIEHWRPPHPLVDRRSQPSDGDGEFKLHGLGRRRYTIKATGGDRLCGFTIVDAAAASAEPFVVTLRPTRRIHLDATAAGTRCVLIADPQGLPLDVSRHELEWPEQTLHLPDGEYQMIVYDGSGAERARERLVVAGVDLQKVLP